ncbi:MAG: hypothetical protein AB8B50_12260 [Pirellulaceae bacterium]
MKVRSFRNTDLEAVCDVWQQHFVAEGADSGLDMEPIWLESFALAKPSFESDQFLIAESEEGGMKGFLHFSFQSDADGADLDEASVSIEALCILPAEDEGLVAKELIENCFGRSPSAKRRVARPKILEGCHYLGVGPCNGLIGITPQETRASCWLTQAGFQIGQPNMLWELDLAWFQPPVDRAIIQTRRATQVVRNEDEPNLNWHQACCMGHTEMTEFQLLGRQRILNETAVRARLLFWQLPTELAQHEQLVAWLCPLEINDSGSKSFPYSSAEEEWLHLFSESARQLQAEGFDWIRVATNAAEESTVTLLHRLGFAPCGTGASFTRQG